MALAALAPSMGWFLGAMVPVGLGFAAVDVGLNAAIGDAVVDPRRRAAAMNLLHGAFPLGTLAAPAGLALAWSLGLNWRTVFLCISAITVAAAATAMAQRGQWPEPTERKQSIAVGYAAQHGRANTMVMVLREGRLVRLAVLIGLYVGVELGIAGWIATYLIDEFQAGEGAGALSTSVYWGGFLVGRPVLAWITHRYGPGRTLPWMMAGGLVTGLAGVVAPTGITATAAFLGTGLAICGVFPTVMALALHDRRGDAGVVTALITAAASIGGLVLPWLVGAIADTAGIRIAMTTAVAPLLIMLPLAWASRHDGAPDHTLAPARASIHSG
jgi:fucose permease